MTSGQIIELLDALAPPSIMAVQQQEHIFEDNIGRKMSGKIFKGIFH